MTTVRLRMLLLVDAYGQLYGVAPSLRDLARTLGLTHGGAASIADACRRRGWLTWQVGRPRTIRVTPAGHAALDRHQPVITIPFERL